ncbi:MAG TPA: Clp protease ClpP [Candidatus Sumerlaeota bacterium]|nr:Clp protease ClpP [Candidatus Sumerlaeota bacterium]
MRPVGEIEILDFIGADFWGEGITAKSVSSAIKAMGDVRRIQVTINSPGGDVFEGLAIYNTLKEAKKPIDVRVLGLAASAASMIAMAGDTITMHEGALMMVHRASGAAYGNAETMMDLAATLEKVDGEMAGIYARRSGMSEETALRMMSEETWLNGAECVECGLATERKGARNEGALVAVAAMLESPRFKGRFEHIPQTLQVFRPAAVADKSKKEEREMPEPTTKETPEVPEAPTAAPIEQINTAKAEGVKAERDRNKAILALAKEYGFEAEADALIDSDKGVDVIRMELMDKRIKALEAKSPAVSDSREAPDAGATSAIKAFEDAVAAKVAAGMAKPQAIAATVREDKARHQAYLAAVNAKKAA